MSLRIGVDLGGTKIEIIAINECNDALIRRRVRTPAGDYSGIITAIAQLVDAVESELGQRGDIGVGTPGMASVETGLMKNANSTVLIGKPFQRDLESRLGRTVRMTNDANCFTLSEATDGAAAGERVVFGVILGTGVGGGIAVDRRIFEGPNRIAGEWGHNPLPWPRADELPGPLCYCGKHGCIETFLSGPGLAREYECSSGMDATAEAIAELAEGAEAAALACIRRYEDRLARSLASAINMFDPDAIVLGGGVSNISRLYEHVPALLPHYVFSDTVRTRIVKAAHGDSSGVRGAAMLVGKTAQYG
jgi:fructokinase